MKNRSTTPALYGTPDVSNLSAACTDAKAIDFDCTEGYGETWEYTEARECSVCDEKLIVSHGEEQHKDVDESSNCEGYISGDGPMFNYLYPLDSCPTDDEIKEALADLPLCVVTKTEASHRWESDAYLALTGGGMDMSWYICTAYVRLGYLPPLSYCSLPNFAGMTLSEEKKLVLAACQETARIEARCAERVSTHLLELDSELRQRGKRPA